MKEEWLFPNAVVPVNVETTAVLVAEIKRLIDVVGSMALAQPEQEPVARRDPEFFTHCVDQPYDWSEWVCPDPKSYLFKCCDCGLVHEAEFGVVRYKSETEREDCDMVNDFNLQAVFRMRRSEQWSPADMAHRAGGLTMEQPAQRKPLTDEQIADIVIEMNGNEPTALFWRDLAKAIEAAHGIKENT